MLLAGRTFIKRWVSRTYIWLSACLLVGIGIVAVRGEGPWNVAAITLLLIPALYGVAVAAHHHDGARPPVASMTVPPPPAPGFEVDHLTAHQTDILRLMALGLTSDQIAEERGTSRRTVESQRKQIMDAIRASDRRMMVSFAISEGLLESGQADRREAEA